MKQKIVWIEGDHDPDFENLMEYLKDGWIVKSITGQHVATGSTSARYGGFIVLLEKNNSIFKNIKL